LKLFLTGDPGCGKTTVVRRVVERLRGSVPMSGFVTEEIRDGVRRSGFRGVTVDGRTFTLARAGAAGDFRVGPYGVTTAELDAVGVPSIEPGNGIALVILDEVGKMESFSQRFRLAVEALLASDVTVLATVASHGVGFPKKVRNDPRVTLVRMRREAREGMVGEILRRLADAGIAAARSGSEAR
jgi:nucleoside-triphosphatase